MDYLQQKGVERFGFDGADRVGELNCNCAILLIHGTSDHVLAAINSQYVHQLAHEPKRLQLYPGANHVLDEAPKIERLVYEWLMTPLQKRPRHHMSP